MKVTVLRPVELEIDATGLPTELMVEMALRECKDFAERLEAQIKSSGITSMRVSVRPVASDALLAAIAAPGARRLEVKFCPAAVSS